MKLRTPALAGVASLALATPAFAAAPAMPAAAAAMDKPAPVSELVKQVDIPYQQFTLKNGLRVVVSPDHKAPIVAVSVWYNVGSKFEPKGKTGFAHLFEHLMFYGSENNHGEFFKPLEEVGATDYNGTTYFDRTNYFETVPRAALDRALFLESDRMGWLTGAITQSVLNQQRGVVENEKRQDDNQPYGMMQYKVTAGLFPPDHPYGHTTIGSMADIDSASLATVKGWFHDHYGPNNAVLVLAGDIDVATAKTLVEKYFGAIPAGPKSVAPPAPIPTLPKPVSETMKDRVAATLITRNWVVPGINDRQSTALDVAAGVLGGLSSSRLKNELVRKEQLAVQVGVENESFSQLGKFSIYVVVKPGVDPAVVDKRIDEILADFLKNGPTADEVERYVATTVSSTIAGYESVGGFGGKAVALASGELYSNDPGFYKKQLADLAAETPADVKAVAQKWLGRPTYALTIVPGPRDAYEESAPPAPVPASTVDDRVKGTRGPLPGVGDIPALAFPKVERTRLDNGIELVYAQRTTVPLTRVNISFDAGTAADVAGKLGTEALTLGMMDEGTTTRDSETLAKEEESLGANIGQYADSDRSTVGVFTPSLNLAPALDLFADVVRHPAFAPAEVARVKNQQLAQIAQELTDPSGLAARALPKVVFAPGSPYAKEDGSGDPKAVAALTRDDLVAFQQAWLRPDKAKIFIVSDRPLAEIKAALNAHFADWKGVGAPGVKSFPASAANPVKPRIVLVDRKDSPQSLIMGGAPNSLKGTDDLLALQVANDGLGGSILSRINEDLRETRHWSYGSYGYFDRKEMAAPYTVQAPVQADKTGESITSLRGDINAYLGDKPMTAEEFDRATVGAIRSLSGNFETSDAVLRAMQNNDLFKRPDDYYATITARYRALTLPQVTAAIKGTLNPNGFVWVVVGDVDKVKPQLDSVGLPVEVMPAASVAGGN